MKAYHVRVPSTLVYYCEAEDERTAKAFVELAIAGWPHCEGVSLQANLTEQRPMSEWDVTDPADHGAECGCDHCNYV